MHVVTSIDSHRTTTSGCRAGPRRRTPAIYFDLASPSTYLAAERAERLFARLRWLPAFSEALGCERLVEERQRGPIAQRAVLLGLPIVWPQGSPVGAARARRVASLAAESRRGGEFVLAASRLMFCGGYDIDDPVILAEAAAAARIDFDEMLRAAGDAGRDREIAQAGRRLVAAGADRLPVLAVGRRLFCGEERLGEAAAAARAAG